MPVVPPVLPLCIDEPAVPLFMPDFDVSFVEGLMLGFESLLDPAAVPAPLPGPDIPGLVCAKAAPDISVKHVAAIKSFFIRDSSCLLVKSQ